MPQPDKATFTRREMEVLELILEQHTTKEIGDILCLSPRTVETYRSVMLDKVGSRNAVGLVVFAMRNFAWL